MRGDGGGVTVAPVGKGLLSKLMADPSNDGPGVKLMDQATIRLQKGEPGRSDGIYIFLQMSDVEEFPLRYSLWPPPDTSISSRLETRRYDVPMKIGIRAPNLFHSGARATHKRKVNRYQSKEIAEDFLRTMLPNPR